MAHPPARLTTPGLPMKPVTRDLQGGTGTARAVERGHCRPARPLLSHASQPQHSCIGRRMPALAHPPDHTRLEFTAVARQKALVIDLPAERGGSMAARTLQRRHTSHGRIAERRSGDGDLVPGHGSDSFGGGWSRTLRGPSISATPSCNCVQECVKWRPSTDSRSTTRMQICNLCGVEQPPFPACALVLAS